MPDTPPRDKRFYLHILNLAPTEAGALVSLTLELEPGRKVIIGRYTAETTVSVSAGSQPEGILCPPDPPGRKPEATKVGLDVGSVSRSHGTFSRISDQVFYQDHSRFGTAYERRTADGPGQSISTLYNSSIRFIAGDVLYFGKHTEEMPFKYSVVLVEDPQP